MKKLLPLLLTLFCTLGCSTSSKDAKNEQTFTVFQLNIWHEGSNVPDGYNAILDVLDEVDADVVFLCEIRDYDGNKFIPRILKDLEARGKTYYGETLDLPVGILSKYKLDDVSKRCIVPGDEVRAMLRASITIAGQPISFYSCHLDYIHYECYMPRGYSGVTWEKINHPITDEKEVLEANRLSFRDESISAFVEDVQADIQNGRLVVLGGDFNEPSHLDWQADTKDLWDHNGAVINWDCSVMLHDAGFVDTYRAQYPSAVSHPAFTFPAGNRVAEEAKLEKLAWAPEVDERDRIDFIYYHSPNPHIMVEKSELVGPSEAIIRGEIVENDSQDEFLVTKSVWPSDHKGNLVTFKVLSSEGR